MRKNKRIIWGFPGIGKSHIADGIRIIDADSNLFKFINVNSCKVHGGSYQENIKDNSNYPENLIEYINQCNADIVLINCHLSILYHFQNVEVIYPHKALKKEYLSRYKERGDSQSFIKYMDECFEEMIDMIEMIPNTKKFKIENESQFLSDVLKTKNIYQKDK